MEKFIQLSLPIKSLEEVVPPLFEQEEEITLSLAILLLRVVAVEQGKEDEDDLRS